MPWQPPEKLFEEEYPDEAQILVEIVSRITKWGRRFFLWDFDNAGNLTITLPKNIAYPGKNEKCRCGSGDRFKDCCQPLIL